MGDFKRWGDRKEAGGHEFMIIEGGSSCWNGPNRSVEVQFECGEKAVIESVGEPEKCEYSMVVRTPAVCRTPVEEVTVEKSSMEDVFVEGVERKEL